MKKYRKKPVVIEAMQWNGRTDQWDELSSFIKSSHAFDNGRLHIFTSEGVMEAAEGDWIIKGVKGEFYPCKPDIFAATYEEVT